MTTPDSATVTDHTRQWLEKAVIGLNLCPFAKPPHVKNLVRISVSQARHLDGFLEDLDRELQLLGDTPADELETTLLVHPTLFPDFDTFNQMLDIADAAVVDNGLEGIVQIAPFHPDFQFEGTDSDDIGNYTNRSPYSTLHLIREDSIAKAAQAFPDASVIFERNIALLEKMGHEGWDKLDIPRCPFDHGKTKASE
ncbi:peptidase [Neisseria sp. HMSC055H02]|nr:peptidase [Neisseria sp. HMSC055H02]